MASQNRARQDGEDQRAEATTREANDVHTAATGAEHALVLPAQSPLFQAQHSERYERQQLIANYEAEFDCRLVVVVDTLFDDCITLFEELVYDADPEAALHLMIDSPGGDGEVAVRLLRSAQARCSELVLVVPDQAKSAATLLALGAHKILLGATSDLGPVDPQFAVGKGNLISAKDLIAAVEYAEKAIEAKPETYPLHAALLPDVTGLMVQQARSALDRTSDLMKEALRSHPDRSEEEVERLHKALQEPLLSQRSHTALFGLREVRAAGLPCVTVDHRSVQWQILWRLWAKYFTLGARIYEGRRSSHILQDDSDD